MHYYLFYCLQSTGGNEKVSLFYSVAHSFINLKFYIWTQFGMKLKMHFQMGGNILGLSFSKIFTLECFIIICMQHSFICLGCRLSMELGTEHTIINISF